MHVRPSKTASIKPISEKQWRISTIQIYAENYDGNMMAITFDKKIGAVNNSDVFHKLPPTSVGG